MERDEPAVVSGLVDRAILWSGRSKNKYNITTCTLINFYKFKSQFLFFASTHRYSNIYVLLLSPSLLTVL